ncbi:MAG: glycosyltransferase family 2 protein [Gallionellaceae bacterium]
MDPKLSIVIPFYQKKKGILIKAVDSALGQSGVNNVEILVVDDSSPISAKSELAHLPHEFAAKIKILEQPNAGPAAARNKALDNVSSGSEYVAFLDSDDEWIAEHLSNALTALDQGQDFYFADHYQLDQTISAFKRARRITPDDHPLIAGSKNLYAYDGDMFDQILRGNIIGTSTVVYRYRKFPTLRFREEFVYAGEDYLFWLELSLLTNRIAFSSFCECTYGKGVNIFAGSGWGTEKSLIRNHYEIKFQKALPRLFHLNGRQLANNRDAISNLRRSFVADLLHRLVHRKPIDQATLIEQLKVDPKSFIYFLPIVASLKLQRGIRMNVDDSKRE